MTYPHVPNTQLFKKVLRYCHSCFIYFLSQFLIWHIKRTVEPFKNFKMEELEDTKSDMSVT